MYEILELATSVLFIVVAGIVIFNNIRKKKNSDSDK